MCDLTSITSISVVKFSNWSIQLINFPTSICVTCFPCVHTLWTHVISVPHVAFPSSRCSDHSEYTIFFYLLECDSLYNKFHCCTISFIQFWIVIMCIFVFLCMLRWFNLAAIQGKRCPNLILAFMLCSATFIYYWVARVDTIARNYFSIASLSNQPIWKSSRIISGTVDLFLLILNYSFQWTH